MSHLLELLVEAIVLELEVLRVLVTPVSPVTLLSRLRLLLMGWNNGNLVPRELCQHSLVLFCPI